MPRVSWFQKLLGISTSEAQREAIASSSSVFSEFDSDTLTGSTALNTYAKMMRDAQVGGSYQQLVAAVVGGGVRVSCEESEEIELWANAALDRVEGSPLDMVEAALLMVAFGFSVQEVVWREWEGKWEPYQIIERAPQKFTWEWDSNAKRNVLKTSSGFNTQEAPVGKYLICRNGNNTENPYGYSILKSAYKNWMSKLQIIKLANVFLEKNASPNLIAKPIYQTTSAMDASVLEAMENMRQTASAVFPSMYEITPLSLGSPNAESQFRGMLGYHDSQIARAILSESLTLEEGGVGARSYGQSAAHATVLKSKGAMLRRKVASAINEQLIRPMVQLNYGEDAPMTKFTIDEPPLELLGEFTDAIEKLVNTGYLAGSEDWVLEKVGLGESDMTDEMRAAKQEAALTGYTTAEQDGGSTDGRADEVRA